MAGQLDFHSMVEVELESTQLHLLSRSLLDSLATAVVSPHFLFLLLFSTVRLEDFFSLPLSSCIFVLLDLLFMAYNFLETQTS